MKRIFVLLVLMVGLTSLTGCFNSDADIVSDNLSKDAEQFKIKRRIVFINGITDEYLFELTGNCSIEADSSDNQLEVTCKIGDDKYQKHFLGLSDNTTYVVEQLEWVASDPYHYKIIFKPESIIPNIDLETSNGGN